MSSAAPVPEEPVLQKGPLEWPAVCAGWWKRPLLLVSRPTAPTSAAWVGASPTACYAQLDSHSSISSGSPASLPHARWGRWTTTRARRKGSSSSAPSSRGESWNRGGLKGTSVVISGLRVCVKRTRVVFISAVLSGGGGGLVPPAFPCQQLRRVVLRQGCPPQPPPSLPRHPKKETD